MTESSPPRLIRAGARLDLVSLCGDGSGLLVVGLDGIGVSGLRVLGVGLDGFRV